MIESRVCNCVCMCWIN